MTTRSIFKSLGNLLLVSLLFSVSSASAKSWQVAQDGSAPYSIIQDAVDAAASGDTILIGRGTTMTGIWSQASVGPSMWMFLCLKTN